MNGTLDDVGDCSSVAPTPGGQPCAGGDVMTCNGLYRWSCPNGDNGVVPMGTVCEWYAQLPSILASSC
jgi:hypothetical protein